MINFVIAFFSGIISGMGFGGGVLLIPGLTLLLNWQQRAAQTVNLLTFIPQAVSALCIHAKEKRVKFHAAMVMGVAGLIAAVFGAVMASIVSPHVLRKGFGFFLLVLAVREFLFASRIKKNVH